MASPQRGRGRGLCGPQLVWRGPDLNSPDLNSAQMDPRGVRGGVCRDLNSRGGVQTSTLLTSTLLRGPNDGEGLLCVCWPRHIPHTSSTDSISAVHTSPPHQRVVVPHHLQALTIRCPWNQLHCTLMTTRLKKVQCTSSKVATSH